MLPPPDVTAMMPPFMPLLLLLARLFAAVHASAAAIERAKMARFTIAAIDVGAKMRLRYWRVAPAVVSEGAAC